MIKNRTNTCLKTVQSSAVALSLIVLFSLHFGCTPRSQHSERPSPYVSDQVELDFTKLSIAYSSPRVRGREIYGTKLVPYGKVWRTGANEATVFSTSDSIMFGTMIVPPGKYSLFAIAGAENWEIILNKEWSQWGSYSYNSKKDLGRLIVSPEKMSNLKEEMTFTFRNDGLAYEWEYIAFNIPIRPMR